MSKLIQRPWIAALPFIAASLLHAAQRKWYWAVFMLCFAAYNVGTRLWDVSRRSLLDRTLLIAPWAVLAVLELIYGSWLGVVVYGGLLAWHVVYRGIRQQRVA